MKVGHSNVGGSMSHTAESVHCQTVAVVTQAVNCRPQQSSGRDLMQKGLLGSRKHIVDHHNGRRSGVATIAQSPFVM